MALMVTPRPAVAGGGPVSRPEHWLH